MPTLGAHLDDALDGPGAKQNLARPVRGLKVVGPETAGRRKRLMTYPNAINRWIAKGELEAFRVEGRGFRFVDSEQVEALRLALEGGRELRS